MKQIISIAVLIFAFCFAAFAQANDCPEITIVTPNDTLVPGKPATISVAVGGKTAKTGLVYEWTVSAGGIVKGQGTPEIEFVATIEENEIANINVDVKITGLPKDCPNTASDIMPVAQRIFGDPVDKFGKIALDDRKARLDSFLIQIANDPDGEGLIVLTLEKRDSRTYKISLLKNILKFLEWRKADLTRISFAISEQDFDEQTTLWLVPPGAKLPIAEDEYYEIIKAEELDQKINELFPKK